MCVWARGCSQGHSGSHRTPPRLLGFSRTTPGDARPSWGSLGAPTDRTRGGNPRPGLTKPGLLVPLHLDGEAEVGQLDGGSLQLGGQQQVLGLQEEGKVAEEQKGPGGSAVPGGGGSRSSSQCCGEPCVPLSTLLRGPRITRTSLPPLPLGVSPQSCCLLCSFPLALGAPMPSHGPFPCASYLQVPVDHPHLVAVQDSLQDLLDAVAAEKRGESSRRCLERHIFLSCTRRAAFPPLAPLPITSVPPCATCWWSPRCRW